MKQHTRTVLGLLSLNVCLLSLGGVGLCALSACGSETTVNDTKSLTTETGWTWDLPKFFSSPKVPDSNPMSNAKVELGRHLFYDKRLSGNGTTSCGTCHLQEKAFTDGLPVAVGSTGMKHPRNSQTLVNVAYSPTLTWANPSLLSIEKQMENPLFGEAPIEMGVNDKNQPEILARFKQTALYQPLFANAYPNEADPINMGNIVHAIAAFQRSIISANSKYDQYLQGKATLTPAETRGMNLFNSEKAECFHCHGSLNFNDQFAHSATRVVETPFHNTGLFNIDGHGAYPEPNRGQFEITQVANDMGKFRAPSLRNIALTAPYTHDGSVATLEEMLANYSAGGRSISSGVHAGDGRTNPYKDDLIVLIDLTAEEQQDIIAFLKSLTDEYLLTNPKFANPFATTGTTSTQP